MTQQARLLGDGPFLLRLGLGRNASRSGTAAPRHRMDQDQAHGARLGWLLLPHERAVEIGRPGQPGMAERLALDLEEIWAVGGCTSGGGND